MNKTVTLQLIDLTDAVIMAKIGSLCFWRKGSYDRTHNNNCSQSANNMDWQKTDCNCTTPLTTWSAQAPPRSLGKPFCDLRVFAGKRAKGYGCRKSITEVLSTAHREDSAYLKPAENCLRKAQKAVFAVETQSGLTVSRGVLKSWRNKSATSSCQESDSHEPETFIDDKHKKIQYTLQILSLREAILVAKYNPRINSTEVQDVYSWCTFMYIRSRCTFIYGLFITVSSFTPFNFVTSDFLEHVCLQFHDVCYILKMASVRAWIVNDISQFSISYLAFPSSEKHIWLNIFFYSCHFSTSDAVFCSNPIASMKLII